MVKRLDKEAYDKAQGGYFAPKTLAPAGVVPGAARPMLTRLGAGLKARVAKGQNYVKRTVTTPLGDWVEGRPKAQPSAPSETPRQ